MTPLQITARALLGIAGASLAPSTLSLIRNMFLDQDQRTFAIGVWATSFSAGAALGPLFGRVLMEYFGWGSVFLVAVPVMALLLVLGPLLLPEFRDHKAGYGVEHLLAMLVDGDLQTPLGSGLDELVDGFLDLLLNVAHDRCPSQSPYSLSISRATSDRSSLN